MSAVETNTIERKHKALVLHQEESFVPSDYKIENGASAIGNTPIFTNHDYPNTNHK